MRDGSRGVKTGSVVRGSWGGGESQESVTQATQSAANAAADADVLVEAEGLAHHHGDVDGYRDGTGHATTTADDDLV